MRTISDYLHDESGASAAEYALILALVAGVIVGGLTLVIHAIANGINAATNSFPSS